MACRGDSVLLEGAVHGEARALGLGAVGLVSAAALVALEARVGKPLDAHPVADLDVLVGTGTQLNNDTGTLVSSDQGELSHR